MDKLLQLMKDNVHNSDISSKKRLMEKLGISEKELNEKDGVWEKIKELFKKLHDWLCSLVEKMKVEVKTKPGSPGCSSANPESGTANAGAESQGVTAGNQGGSSSNPTTVTMRLILGAG